MSFAVRVRMEELVAVQTQLLDAGGALSVDGRNATDGAGLCRTAQKIQRGQEPKDNIK